MGMDAFIDDSCEGVRFSQLLSEVTFQLYPEIQEQVNKEAYFKLSKEQVGEICKNMAEILSDYPMDALNPIAMMQAQYVISNMWKLHSLLTWYHTKDEQTLTFA